MNNAIKWEEDMERDAGRDAFREQTVTAANKTYMTSRSTCQQNIDARNYVCSGCGGMIVPIETVDNADRPTFWAGCLQCSCFDFGVPKEIYETARDLVINRNHVQYPHLGNAYGKRGDELQNWQRSQIRGTSTFVIQVLISYETAKTAASKL